MDPRDRLRPLLDGVGCTACGTLVPADRIRILAHRDDLAFVELACLSCRSEILGLLIAPDEAADAASRPISMDEVQSMRDFLAGWSGDVRSLVGRRDDGDDRPTPKELG